MSSTHAKPTPGRLLRDRLDAGVTAAPGAFCGLVARAAANAGFDALYVSGGATSAASGVPDIGLLTLDRFCQAIREVTAAARTTDDTPVPVLADADTGFGEEEMVRRTALEYAHAGAAGMHLEDQVFPKRCGHLDGKACVSIDHMMSKIAWAAGSARDSADEDFLVCARTDARSVEGFDAAVARATEYVAAGAEMVFPEGLTSEDEFARFKDDLTGALEGRHLPHPYLLANMTEFGKTPHIPVARFGEIGYHLVIFPVTTLRIAMGAVARGLAALKDAGTAAGLVDQMQTRAELYDLLGYEPGTPFALPRA